MLESSLTKCHLLPAQIDYAFWEDWTFYHDSTRYLCLLEVSGTSRAPRNQQSCRSEIFLLSHTVRAKHVFVGNHYPINLMMKLAMLCASIGDCGNKILRKHKANFSKVCFIACVSTCEACVYRFSFPKKYFANIQCKNICEEQVQHWVFGVVSASHSVIKRLTEI